MPIRKKGDRLGAKKRFDPRTGEETNKPGGKDPRTIYRPKPDVKPTEMKTGGLSPKQKAIASKAPPPNKITGADFAVLKKEKAKGRGMGLQDEKIKPGKIYKANKGMSFSDKMKLQDAKVIDKKTGKTHLSKDQLDDYVKKQKNPYMKQMGKLEQKYIKERPKAAPKSFPERRKQLGGGRSKLPGRIGTALGIGAMMVPAAYGVMKQYKDYKSAKNRDKAKVKKMGGGMMKKYSKGGGADSGRIGEMKSRIGVAMNKAKRLAKRLRSTDRLTDRDIEKASSLVKGKMGGGMIAPSQRPGYSKGTMVKARGCKLGRTRPTKIT